MKLESILKTSLDELRMQMLGAQALFGFQVQGLFQDNFEALGTDARIVNGIGLGCMVMVLGLIVAVPCQHRIVERGEATTRILRISLLHAKYTLAPLAGAVSCDIYVAARAPFGARLSAIIAITALFAALAAWYVLGLIMRQGHRYGALAMEESNLSLHEKIAQLLTEARVILPGAQALLGFQFVVMMTRAFANLAPFAQLIHLAALVSLVIAVILLISPAAIHRLTFEGRDDPRLHRVGSRIVTIALLPLGASIACDIWVALYRLSADRTVATWGAILTGVTLAGLWFALPMAMRAGVRQAT
jgi:hypothetical protein